MALSALRGVAARGAGPALRRPAPAMNLAIGSRSRRPLVTLTQKHALALPRSAIDERRRGIWSFLRNRQLKRQQEQRHALKRLTSVAPGHAKRKGKHKAIAGRVHKGAGMKG